MRNKTTILIIAFLIFPSILYAGSWEGKVVGIQSVDMYAGIVTYKIIFI